MLKKIRRLWLRVSLVLDVPFGFPYRLLTLYWFVRNRRRQCTDFTVGDTVRLKASTRNAMNSRIMITPRLQAHFSELGEADAAGNRECKLHYTPGSAIHSFFEARDPWQVTSVDCCIAARSYLLWNRYPSPPCILIVENSN